MSFLKKLLFGNNDEKITNLNEKSRSELDNETRRSYDLIDNFDENTIKEISTEIKDKFNNYVISGEIPIFYYDEVKLEMESWGTLEQFENGETEGAVDAHDRYTWGNSYLESGLILGSLIKEFGEEIGTKLFLKEVWKGMKQDELLISRGAPDDIETIELEKNKNYLIYIYESKKYGSYFKIQDNIVIEFTDRMKKRDLLSNT